MEGSSLYKEYGHRLLKRESLQDPDMIRRLKEQRLRPANYAQPERVLDHLKALYASKLSGLVSRFGMPTAFPSAVNKWTRIRCLQACYDLEQIERYERLLAIYESLIRAAKAVRFLLPDFQLLERKYKWFSDSSRNIMASLCLSSLFCLLFEFGAQIAVFSKQKSACECMKIILNALLQKNKHCSTSFYLSGRAAMCRSAPGGLGDGIQGSSQGSVRNAISYKLCNLENFHIRVFASVIGRLQSLMIPSKNSES